MRKLFFIVVFLIVANQSFAQATMQDLEKLRIIHNSETCIAFKQPSNCTSLPEIPDPADPTKTIVNPNKLFPDTNAGRLECERVYAQVIVNQVLLHYKQIQEAKRLERAKVRFEAATQAEKDRFCELRGEAAGCDPFASN